MIFLLDSSVALRMTRRGVCSPCRERDIDPFKDLRYIVKQCDMFALRTRYFLPLAKSCEIRFYHCANASFQNDRADEAVKFASQVKFNIVK